MGCIHEWGKVTKDVEGKLMPEKNHHYICFKCNRYAKNPNLTQ